MPCTLSTNNNFDPRLAVAWSHGNTVVRAGGGIYHTDGQEDQNLPISNTVDRYTFTNVQFPGLSYPLTPYLTHAENGGLGVVTSRVLARHPVRICTSRLDCLDSAAVPLRYGRNRMF
jgi:hypothetical protein